MKVEEPDPRFEGPCCNYAGNTIKDQHVISVTCQFKIEPEANV